MWDLDRFAENTAVIDDRGNVLSYAGLQAYGNELCSHLKSRSLVMGGEFETFLVSVAIL